MNDRDASHGQCQPTDQSSSQGDPASNPPIIRHVVWNEANQDWDIGDTGSPKAGKKKPIILPDESGGHEIHFNLRAPGKPTWQFDTNDPIWTADNVQCGSLSKRASDQVSIVDPQPMLLKVFDKNDGEARLIRYQLNFVNSGTGSQPPACDPTILNGGND